MITIIGCSRTIGTARGRDRNTQCFNQRIVSPASLALRDVL